MAAPYTIKNPQNPSPNNPNPDYVGVAELDVSGIAKGNIQPGSQTIGILNNGDGAGGGSDMTIGVPGNEISVPPGASKTYPVPRPGSAGYPEISFTTGGNKGVITVIY